MDDKKKRGWCWRPGCHSKGTHYFKLSCETEKGTAALEGRFCAPHFRYAWDEDTLSGDSMVQGMLSKKDPQKSWCGILCDADGRKIKALTAQAPTYDLAFRQMLEQAKSIPRAFMVHLGLGQRLVKAQPAE